MRRITWTLGMAAVLLLASAQARENWDDYLDDDAFDAGRLPHDLASIDTLTRFCVARVDHYLDEGPVPAAVPDSVRVALRFLEFYPHPAAAELAVRLAALPALEIENSRADRLAMYGVQHTLSAATSQGVGRHILVSLRDPRALDVVMATRRWTKSDMFDTIDALAQIPGSGSREALHALTEMPALADSLAAASTQPGWDERRRTGFRNQCERDAEMLQDKATRALRLHAAAARGLMCPFSVSAAVLDQLQKQGVAVSDEEANEHFELLRPEYPFVTSDAIWHAFMRLTATTYESLETVSLHDMLTHFTADLARAATRRGTNADPETRESAWRVGAMASVAARLLDAGDLPVLPSIYATMVDDEVLLVDNAEGPADSPLRGRTEDYAAYRPRGRHSDPQTDQAFFRAMTWCGRFTWRLSEAQGKSDAILLASLLAADSDLLARWQAVDTLLTLFFGPADDATPADVLAVIGRVTGAAPDAALAAGRHDSVVADALDAALATLPAPVVNTDAFAYSPGQARGVRLFGLRSTPDARLFQRLMDSGVWPVSGFDMAAALLGSDHARDLRSQTLDPGARKAWERVLATPDLMPRMASLNSTGLDVLATLMTTPPGAPTALATDAWRDKQLNTTLAAWAELRHVTHVFVKEAHMYSGLSAVTDAFHGYVEPYPDFYRGLRDLARQIVDAGHACGLWEELDVRLGRAVDIQAWRQAHPAPKYDDLKRRGASFDEFTRIQAAYMDMLDAIRKHNTQSRMRACLDRWADFQELMAQLEDLARRELAGQPQTPADCELLRGMPGRLKRLSMNDNSSPIAETPISCVIDVAVSAESCVEAAVGRPRVLYVVVETGGRRQVCRGSISTYYEFPRLATERLDDANWRELASDRLITPWLLEQPAFAATRTLSRAQLGALLDEKPGRFDILPAPYAARREQFPYADVRALSGMRVDPQDRDLLVLMLVSPHHPAGTIMWAAQQILRQPHDARTLACLREIWDEYRRGKHPGTDAFPCWQLQTVILGLTGYGDESATFRADVCAVVDAFPAGRRPEIREYFTTLLHATVADAWFRSHAASRGH